MEKPVRERIIEQPCCGCIHFRECGTITRRAPDNCERRVTCEEAGGIPDRGDYIRGTNINSDNDFMCRPTRDWMD